jgi:hypothetical protein
VSSGLVEIPSKVVISTRQTSKVVGERDASRVNVSENSVSSSEMSLCCGVCFGILNAESEFRYGE